MAFSASTGLPVQFYLHVGDSPQATDNIQSFLSSMPYPAYQVGQSISLCPRLPDDQLGPFRDYEITAVRHTIVYTDGGAMLINRTYLTVQ